ncbi:WXG100 family type VII secretion target [Mycolicibacterium grossiae]|uniref:ESX-1 secretion-associated protein n=1 Tax=Mycolicibacterium grossiae TaxID=1552759 RepID=A0A1E8QAC1_9MYCO|nr:type VII secretion target [Mycolicibacterium grossiae]OFJ55527.1 hypothetical protein BEL07_01055 [Mycolicibacterium grossiae]QEM45156.1 hypothetical protein FZ046_10575 [Mycolicibacterium grossiae]
MLVDPDVLRAFAGQVDVAAREIGAGGVAEKLSSAGDALPGSTTQWAAHTVGEHFTHVLEQLSQNVVKMGTAVRGAGDAYEVADDALAGQFDGLF